MQSMTIDRLISYGFKYLAIEAVGNIVEFESIVLHRPIEYNGSIGGQSVSLLFPWSVTAQGDKFWRNVYRGQDLFQSNEYLRGVHA